MAADLKPLKPYGINGPNPPKIIMLLEELGVPYEAEEVSFETIKDPKYLAINPNGRKPALHDPNNGLTIWESGAIVEYLVERYDKDNKLSFPLGSNDAQLARQWLFFQVTGQGPYYGQSVWFARYHPERVVSAIERYIKEINRVTGVLEDHLAKQKGNVSEGPDADGPWLVGDRMTYADLAFVPWQYMVAMGEPDPELSVRYDIEKFPNVKKWLNTMLARPAVGKALSQAKPSASEFEAVKKRALLQ